LEVLMLADSGIRSLRTRETTLNAFVVDIGSPIDSLVTALLATLTDAEKALSCSIVEPSSNRYWLFVPGHSGAAGKIYVLSYFPSAQVIAWSTYDPTYDVVGADWAHDTNFDEVTGKMTLTGLTAGATYQWVKGFAHSIKGTGANEVAVTADGDFIPKGTSAIVTAEPGESWNDAGTHLYPITPTAFSPQSFCVFDGQVFARDGSALYAYGGTGGQVYDSSPCQAEPPWMCAQAPATRKTLQGIDVSMDGRWDVSIGTNLADETDIKLIYENTGASFFIGGIPCNRIAPFYKLRFQSVGTGAAKFCSVMVHFQQGDQK
jgi:hypothetical protein